MATCKKCNVDCIIKVSRSAVNPGREFYCCPNECKGWIGWAGALPALAPAQASAQASAQAPVQASVQVPAQAPAPPKPNTNSKVFVPTSDVKCKGCGAECTQRTSNTPKNRGKMFWGCKKGCKVWNGWIDDITSQTAPMVPQALPENHVKDSNGDSNGVRKTQADASHATAAMASRPISVKRKAPSILDDDDAADTEAFNPKKAMISYYCLKCDKVLDINHEIKNNIKRLTGLKGKKTPIEVLRINLRNELLETITNEDYTCEKCLGNE